MAGRHERRPDWTYLPSRGGAPRRRDVRKRNARYTRLFYAAFALIAAATILVGAAALRGVLLVLA